MHLVCIQARPISTNPGSMEEVRENGLSARDVLSHTPSRHSIGRPAGVDFVVRVESGGITSFYLERIRLAARVRPPSLISLYSSSLSCGVLVQHSPTEI